MSLETKNRLLDVAERIFAERGFAASSFRIITSQAGVNLGAIHYHFGSKAELFDAVVRRRLVPLAQTRLDRLSGILARAGHAAPPLEEVVDAFVRPVLELLLEAPQTAAWIKLIGWCRVEPGQHWECVEEEMRETYRRFRATFQRSLAHLELPPGELEYRMYFFLGAETNTLTDLHGLRTIDPTLKTVFEDPDAVLDRLVRFAAAGFRAPSPSPSPSRSTSRSTSTSTSPSPPPSPSPASTRGPDSRRPRPRTSP